VSVFPLGITISYNIKSLTFIFAYILEPKLCNAKILLIADTLRCASASINRYFCYLLPNVVWLAIVACREQNKTLNKGDWTGPDWVFCWSRAWLGLVWFQSGSRSGRHLHMFPVTFDDYMIFLLFTRSWLQFLFCFRLPLAQRVRGNSSGAASAVYAACAARKLQPSRRVA